MKYSLQSLVDEYTRANHYKPTQLTPASYAPSAYVPTRYAASSYAPSQYSSSLHTPRQSSGRYSSASGFAPALRSSPNHAPSRRSLKAGRTVHFPNDVIFQDHIRHGDLQQVGRFLRARKVRVNNFFPTGMAAIHEAVLSGNLDCVKLLVTYGADVHLRDEDGWTALHMACSDGYPDIARYLLSLGASKLAETESGEKPTDLIDTECTELVKLFEVGCV